MAFKLCSVGANRPKVCQIHTITPIVPNLNIWHKTGFIHYFMWFPKFSCYHPNNTAEFETHHIRQAFPSMQTVVWLSCSELAGVALQVVFCCCRPSGSRLYMLCGQKCSPAYLSCNKWLFGVLLPQFKAIWPFSSEGILTREMLLIGYFLCFGPLSVNSRDDCMESQ